MPSAPDRLTFIDFARTYAVFLALLSHALNTTGTFQHMGESSLYIRQFTRMATPMFVFMFGFMIEFVYARKARLLGLESVQRRLLVRSFQCYFAYGLTSLCSVLGGFETLDGFLRALLFLGDSRFGNILRVYAVLMLMVPLLIRFRLRYGPKAIYLALVLVIFSFPLLNGTESFSFGRFDHPLNVLAGLGPALGGPSVWHSLSFLLAGMFLASSLNADGPIRLSRFYLFALVLLVTCVVLRVLLVADPFPDAWWKFVDFTYRTHNMAGYFVIGIFGSVVSIGVVCFLVGVRKLPRPIQALMPVGYASLFSYTLGNVLLNLFGSFAGRVPSLVFLIPFFAAVLVITSIRKRLLFYDVLNDILNFRFNKVLQRTEP